MNASIAKHTTAKKGMALKSAERKIFIYIKK